MSRQLSDRNTHFSKTVLPGPVMALRAQTASVEFNGVVALYTGMSPHERAIAERALTDRRYGQRVMSNGMTCYVLQPVKAQAAAAQPQTVATPRATAKPKLSKQQRAAAEKKLLAEVEALVADMPAAVKPKKLRNRHDDLAAARTVKQMITGQ